ncbi:MAG: hypothetical protein HYZ42_11640 [Bacteroidetes bacterium]|nr:hypothetical protein [Bacteroidota bacterium]
MKTLILLCGFYNIGFAIFHISFWKIFHWDSDLKKLSFANKAVMQLLNVQIIYYFLFIAFICFAFPAELLTTKLGNLFLGGTSLFWLIRTIQQFIFLRANHFKIHILTIIFLIGTILFALPILIQ